MAHAKQAPPLAVADFLQNGHGHSSAILMREVEWFRTCLDQRLLALKQTDHDFQATKLPQAPQLPAKGNGYCQLVNRLGLTDQERLVLLAAMLPHFYPTVLAQRLTHPERPYVPLFPEAGGFVSKENYQFFPTLSTALFMSVGNEPHQAAFFQLHLLDNSRLFKDQILQLEPWGKGLEKQALCNHVVVVASEYLRFFLTGESPRPDFGTDFPATLLETNLMWDDLVLSGTVLQKVNKVMRWVEHGPELLKLGGGKVNKSFPCLFYGAPGTGKTMTAKLIGKTFDKPVFRIDLSMVVSKYIGETEKNLARLFDRAEGKDWILFFDEADSLFGKRTQINDSNDKWANLEMSYLLQRIEEYSGLVIMATNLMSNIDSAMTRRFQLQVEFSKPTKDLLPKLWQKCLPDGFKYSKNVDFSQFNTLSLTGANIANVLKAACLDALSSGSKTLSQTQLVDNIREELTKEKRTF